MRPGSAGLVALLWGLTGSNLAMASPLGDGGRQPMPMPMPALRPRQQTGTGVSPTPTTAEEASTPPTPTPTSEAEATTTVTLTTTVGGGGSGKTTTVDTTIFRTITTTIVVTTTTFETTTVTSSDVATATETEFVTSTVLAKRSLNFLAAETAPVDAPAAHITPAAADLRKFAIIEKRAVVTVLTTVSAPASGEATVVNTRTSTVVFTTTSNLVRTSTITSVHYDNAQTTITVTSTLTVTSTSIETSPPTTVANGPTTGDIGTATGTHGPSATGGSGSGNGGGSGELSSGAKAGIGVGVGVVGLAALIGLGYWFYKRRRANRPSASDLADMRDYDPNGPSPLNDHGMSETGPAFGGAAAAATRRQPPPRGPKSGQLSPPAHSVSPLSNSPVSPAKEYHGSGYSRPSVGGATELGDTRVLPPEMGGDEVAEMGDGRPRLPQKAPQQHHRPGMAFQSGPVSDVYEMPSENYR